MNLVIFGLALCLSGFAVLAVFKAPVYALWKPAVVSTAAGHFLAVLAALVFFAAMWRQRSSEEVSPVLKYSQWLAAASFVLLLSPLARGIVRARSVASELESVAPGTQAAGGRAPLGFGALWLGVSSGEVERLELGWSREGRALPYDFYRARSGVNAPLLVMVHGGSWQGGDKEQLSEVNRHFARCGYNVVAISYGLAPQHHYEVMIEDILGVIDHLRGRASELGFDRDRIGIVGRSAGGHLALAAAYGERAKELSVRCVVALYPPTDLIWSWSNPGNPWVLDTHASLNALFGGPIDEHRARYTQASPLLEAEKREVPPTLLIHGGRDELVTVRQSLRLAEVLSRRGVSHAALILPWATHGHDAFLGGPGAQLSMYAMERFLSSKLVMGDGKSER